MAKTKRAVGNSALIAVMREVIKEIRALRNESAARWDQLQQKREAATPIHQGYRTSADMMFDSLQARRLSLSAREFITSLKEDYVTRGLTYRQTQALERIYHRYCQ